MDAARPGLATMTDILLGLVPTYGLWLIMGALLLSCLALPVPSSILVMTTGGFAASGDLVLWQVQISAFGGFVIGDQLAYGLARKGGAPLLASLRRHPRMEGLFGKAEGLLNRRGPVAVFLSRTVFSPLGPYMGYLSGALSLPWASFTLAAVLGAICWCGGYSLLGYVFASQIAQVASLIGNAIGIVLLGTLVLATGFHLWRSWRRERGEPSQNNSETADGNV